MVRYHPDILSLSEFFIGIGGGHAFPDFCMSGEDFWRWFSTFRGTTDRELFLSDIKLGETLGSLSFTQPDAHPLDRVVLPHLGIDRVPFLTALEKAICRRSPMSVGEHLLFVIHHLCDKLRKTLWVERSGNSLTYVKVLSAKFPNAKLVHLYRNGMECAYSMARHPLFYLELARYLTKNQMLTYEQAQQMRIPLARFGTWWSSQIVWGMRHLATLESGRVLHLSYESLCEQPENSLEKMFDFVGAKWERSLRVQMAKIESRSSKLAQLERSELQRLRESCLPGETMLAKLRLR